MNKADSTTHDSNSVQKSSAMNNDTPHIPAFVVDQDKNLFKITENERIFVQKLYKNPHKITQFNSSWFLMDVFGDCFILKDTPVFLFGILSSPVYFNAINNRIYSIDKYNRVWVHDLDGEIINIAFIKERVMDVYINHNYCCILTAGKKVMIFDRSFINLKTIEVEELVKCDENGIVYIVDGQRNDLMINGHLARKSLCAV